MGGNLIGKLNPGKVNLQHGNPGIGIGTSIVTAIPGMKNTGNCGGDNVKLIQGLAVLVVIIHLHIRQKKL